MYTVKQAQHLILSLESRTLRLPELLGFKSKDISTAYKKLITACNSFTIYFLNLELYDAAKFSLQRAARADLRMNRFRMVKDNNWSGRIILYNLCAFYHTKFNKLTLANDAVCNAETLMQLFNDRLVLLTHLVRFIVKVKIKEFEQAHLSLNQVSGTLKKNNPACKEFSDDFSSFCAIAHCVLIALVTNNWDQAISMYNQSIDHIEIYDLSLKESIQCLSYHLTNKNPNIHEFLVNEETENTLVKKLFVLFVSKKIPQIKIHQSPIKKIFTRKRSLAYEKSPWWNSKKVIQHLIKSPTRHQSELRSSRMQSNSREPSRRRILIAEEPKQSLKRANLVQFKHNHYFLD